MITDTVRADLLIDFRASPGPALDRRPVVGHLPAAHGLRPEVADARRRFGFGLTALAVAKLLLFDLAALPGMARIFAFIVSGIVLIVLAIWYARAADHARAEHP